MSKILKILISICFLGFFIIPVEALACSSHTTETIKKEESCCDHPDDSSKEACEKDCCKDDEGNSGCSGSCGAKSCHNSSQTFLIHQIVRSSYSTIKYEDDLSYPPYKQPYYFSRVYSIWQPPKIS